MVEIKIWKKQEMKITPESCQKRRRSYFVLQRSIELLTSFHGKLIFVKVVVWLVMWLF